MTHNEENNQSIKTGPELTQIETKWGPVGLPGIEAFLFPISCKQDSSLHDLSWVPKGRLEQLLTKGGAARNHLRQD